MGYNRVILSRPYDAQIEYLEATGTQYIDTEIVSQNNLIYDFQLTETQENNQKTFFGFKEGETETWLVNGMNDVNWGGVDETGHWLYVDFAANHTRCALGYPDRNGVYHFDFTDGNASFTLNDTTVWTSALSGTYDGSRHVFIFWMDSVWNYPQNDQYDRKGIGRISYFQIRKNDNLLFDGIPVRKGNEGFIYDRVSGKLFGNKGTGSFVLGQDIPNTAPTIRHVVYTRPYDDNQGTGNFILGNDVANQVPNIRRVIPMPYDRKVEYLEVDDNANTFIDTGILPSNSISVVARIQVLEGYNGFLFEGGKEGSVNEIGFLLKTGQGKVDFRFGNKVSSAFYTFPTEPFLISSFDNPNVLVVNGTNFSVTSPTFSTNYLYSIYLFGQHRINSSSGSAKNCRIYWFKMYNNGVLIRDFIPVRKNGIGYMYDKVSGKLFGNGGTGNFILGQDINN